MENLKTIANNLSEAVKPYQTYILAAAAALVLDYFLFNGKGSDKIKSLLNRINNKLWSVIDAGADRILGKVENPETLETVEAVGSPTSTEAIDIEVAAEKGEANEKPSS